MVWTIFISRRFTGILFIDFYLDSNTAMTFLVMNRSMLHNTQYPLLPTSEPLSKTSNRKYDSNQTKIIWTLLKRQHQLNSRWYFLSIYPDYN
ncbi:BTE_collapsed_G0004250.mRNA.1.CDS.1 [Saccharomyces cerevisiae]|nr:BTE_collapsed_G0004250.mRNA.1.CDS.1 [Saccharomyces cerevisiae]